MKVHIKEVLDTRKADMLVHEHMFVDCEFSGGPMRMTTLIECTFDGCTFSGTQADRCIFENCTFENCTFDNARVRRSIFRHCSLLLNEGLLSLTRPLLCDFYTEDTHVELASWPTVVTMAGVRYLDLPGELVVELMLRDMANHPEPQSFLTWANGGPCPLKREDYTVDRMWDFFEYRSLLKSHKGPLHPTMTDAELVRRLLHYLGWSVLGYTK